MRLFFAITVLSPCLVLSASSAGTQVIAQQSVTMNASALRLISASGTPGILSSVDISSAAAPQNDALAIARGAEQNHTIYQFSGSTWAGTFTSLRHTVTLTLTGP